MHSWWVPSVCQLAHPALLRLLFHVLPTGTCEESPVAGKCFDHGQNPGMPESCHFFSLNPQCLQTASVR